MRTDWDSCAVIGSKAAALRAGSLRSSVLLPGSTAACSQIIRSPPPALPPGGSAGSANESLTVSGALRCTLALQRCSFGAPACSLL